MKTDCYVIVLDEFFLAWDQEANEAMIFTSKDDAKEEALTYVGYRSFAIAPVTFDGGKITVDYEGLAWQTFPSKATKQHSR